MAEPSGGGIYDQAKRHMLAAMAVGVGIIWGAPAVMSLLGMSADARRLWLLAAGIAWLLYFGLRSFRLACPQCGQSVFLRGPLSSVPWPARSCSKCGRDLTVGDSTHEE